LVLRIWVLKPRPVGGVLYFFSGELENFLIERQKVPISLFNIGIVQKKVPFKY
jgi:hypothetical protein